MTGLWMISRFKSGSVDSSNTELLGKGFKTLEEGITAMCEYSKTSREDVEKMDDEAYAVENTTGYVYFLNFFASSYVGEVPTTKQ